MQLGKKGDDDNTMSKSTFHSLDDKFKFGMHRGKTLGRVMETFPAYVTWCLENIDDFMMSSNLIKEIREKYPLFDGEDLLDRHAFYEPEEDDEDYYDEMYYEELCYEMDEDDYHETEHYEEFAGTYVQDEMGWSDEMIYEVLDGEPDAYWNLD